MTLSSKLHSLVLLIFCATPFAGTYAQPNLTTDEVTAGIIRAVTNYGNGISCGDTVVTPKDIAALVPYKATDAPSDAEFVVVWSGDITCVGASGTTYANIATVRVGLGASFYVSVHESSPIIEVDRFGSYERVVGNTKDTLILLAHQLGPNDPRCCPSVPVRVTLKRNANGNWKVVGSRVLQAEK